MKIVIIGAGELGQMLAAELGNSGNDIVIIDSSEHDFKKIRSDMDVMAVAGEATDVSVMKRAGVGQAEMLIAVSGDQASNILACQIARRLGAQNSICRIYSKDTFSENDGLSPDFFGIDKVLYSNEECVKHIVQVLKYQIVREYVEFSNPDATLVTAEVPADSPLRGVMLKNIPDEKLVANVRVAAIVHGHQLKFPRGETIVNAGDLIYIAGHREYVERFIRYVTGHEEKKKIVIIGGITKTGTLLAEQLIAGGYEVRMVDANLEACEHFLSDMPGGIRVINGDITDREALLEAGIHGCDAYVCTDRDDENCILSCILAKRFGAQKVVAIAHKPGYIDVFSEMEAIDCGFNSTVISANTVFRMMNFGSMRIDMLLRAYDAYFAEFVVTESSEINGLMLKNCPLPKSIVLAMIFREDSVQAPSGSTEFRTGDVIVAIVTSESEAELRRYI